MHRLSTLQQTALERLQADLANLNGSILISPQQVRPAQRRTDPSEELPELKGLGDVIVCADVERGNLIFFLIANGEHDNREERSLFPDAATGRYSTNARHVQVKQHDIA
jgi:hypothetical protein